MTFLHTNKRIIIIGLDGVPYSLIKDLSVRGVMPNMSKLIEENPLRQMESSIPDVSSVAWSSIITGKNPGEHGIYGFVDLIPGTYRLYFPNFANLYGIPFWNYRNGRRSIIINVPSTYPASELNGILISGFVALDLEKAVYPPSLVPELRRLNYRIDVDSEKGHQSLELFIEDLNRTLEARIETYRYLWGKEDWDYFMLVFTGTDRLSHFLWAAYEDNTHGYHKTFLQYFSTIDQVIGEIATRMRPEDALIVLSDHGFERMKRTIHINYYLRKTGFLKTREDPAASYDDIDGDTRAFALEPARIYVNTAAKYPRGGVKEKDKEAVIGDLLDIFNSLEVEGDRVINQVYRKEDIYTGLLLDRAPDVVLIPNSGFDLKARLQAETLTETPIFTGKHTQNDAFLLVKSSEDCFVPENPSVFDVFGILENLI
ncbi:MAG: alkaline phosphatase family protein [Pseudomonadota bacterium]